jgi:hypothetical protein
VGEAAPDDRRALLVLELVGTAAPELGLEPELELAVGGVNGTVTPRPGSSVDCTLAVNCVKVLLPVVGGLMAPNMLEEALVRTGRVRIEDHRLPALAVRGATAEEPDGSIGVGNLQRVYTDLARSRIVGKETRVKPVLVGGGIQLP